jgi:hypothetical protein
MRPGRGRIRGSGTNIRNSENKPGTRSRNALHAASVEGMESGSGQPGYDERPASRLDKGLKQ